MKLRLIGTFWALTQLLLAFFFAGCSSDKDEPEEIQILNLSAQELQFSSAAGEHQWVNVTCTDEWSTKSDCDWIDISPKIGNGDGSISITVNSDNLSSSIRNGKVTVTAGNIIKEIDVTQNAAFKSNCNVAPDDIVALSDEIGCNFLCDKNVSYFYWTLMEKNKALSYTDNEIESELKSLKPQTVEDSHHYFYTVGSIDGENWLTSDYEYVIITLGFDSNGKRGDIVKTSVKTKSAYNQPEAKISWPKWNGSQWTWKTTINAYTKEYYYVSQSGKTLEDMTLYDKPYSYIARFILNAIEKYPDKMAPCIQSASFAITPTNTPCFVVATYAMDKDNIWSGYVNYWWRDSDVSADAPGKKIKEKRVRPRNERVDIREFDYGQYYVGLQSK